jgi:cytochrome c553
MLRADGVTSRFFKKDGKYIINTQGDDGRNHDYEVKFTFGYYPLQQYLVEFPGGRMQVPRTSFDVVKKKWYHQYAGQKIHPHDWLHWTKQSQNWNSMCASCHSTNLQRNYDEATDTYHTTWSNLTVSCESCHGMGKNHVDYVHTNAYLEGKKVKGSYLALYPGQNNSEQLDACVQCHSRRMEITATAGSGSGGLDPCQRRQRFILPTGSSAKRHTSTDRLRKARCSTAAWPVRTATTRILEIYLPKATPSA